MMTRLETSMADWPALVADNALWVLPAALGLAVLLLVALILARRRQTPVVVAPDSGDLVRSPRFLDIAVLSDVLAHVEDVDHGRNLRDALEVQESTDEARAVAVRTEKVRALNKALAASRRRPDLAVLLNGEIDELPQPGTIVEARGPIRILPASRVADLVVRAEPLFTPVRNQPPLAERESSTIGSLLTRSRVGSIVPTEPPIVAAMQTPHGGLLMVLDAECALAPIRDGDVLSVLAVIGREVSRRNPATPGSYLPDHLPTDLRQALEGRDLADVAIALSKATAEPLRRRHLVERGPGAIIRPAAIW